jgi:hypothetical protein
MHQPERNPRSEMLRGVLITSNGVTREPALSALQRQSRDSGIPGAKPSKQCLLNCLELRAIQIRDPRHPSQPA